MRAFEDAKAMSPNFQAPGVLAALLHFQVMKTTPRFPIPWYLLSLSLKQMVFAALSASPAPSVFLTLSVSPVLYFLTL